MLINRLGIRISVSYRPPTSSSACFTAATAPARPEALCSPPPQVAPCRREPAGDPRGSAGTSSRRACRSSDNAHRPDPGHISNTEASAWHLNALWPVLASASRPTSALPPPCGLPHAPYPQPPPVHWQPLHLHISRSACTVALDVLLLPNSGTMPLIDWLVRSNIGGP